MYKSVHAFYLYKNYNASETVVDTMTPSLGVLA